MDQLEKENESLKKVQQGMEDEMNVLSNKLEELTEGNTVVTELNRLYIDNSIFMKDN